MPHILIVDDSALERTLVRVLVQKRLSYECLEASSGAEAIACVQADTEGHIAAVLLDLCMPEMNGRAVLTTLHGLRPDLPVIVITGNQAVSDVVEVIKLGATDYLVKPPNPDLLCNHLVQATHLYELRREVLRLRGADGVASGFSDLIGSEPALRRAVALGQKAAGSDITVLITGESGTGKEKMARGIHAASARRDRPFVAVNCGAIPKDLVESTLFGHKKGAFTGATTDSIGKFREADGGTLFLDEIGELPLEAQVKLLHALQQREVEPVGGNATLPVNIRIIAATNRDPEHALRQGHLREDLFYRLNVFPIPMPALRERRGDIPNLARHFLHHYAALENRTITGFDPAAEAWMLRHEWSGNVRELENSVFRAVLLCDRPLIGLDHLRGYSGESASPILTIIPTEATRPYLDLVDASGAFKNMKQLEAEIERAALAFYDNNIAKAAECLNVGKSTLYRHRQG